jgi:hypothetical protein
MCGLRCARDPETPRGPGETTDEGSFSILPETETPEAAYTARGEPHPTGPSRTALGSQRAVDRDQHTRYARGSALTERTGRQSNWA